jgi:integrase
MKHHIFYINLIKSDILLEKLSTIYNDLSVKDLLTEDTWTGMEPEKFLTHPEFNALLNAANDDRERCVLLLLAGAGLRVGEMNSRGHSPSWYSSSGPLSSSLI